MESQEKVRKNIARTVRELRQSRAWTQARLASQLDLSQSRLSEIERGQGSLTAEQLLRILQLFNVQASRFTGAVASHTDQLQNALVRLGAAHLVQVPGTTPSEHLSDVGAVVRTTLVDGSPRFLTALGPVIVGNLEGLHLARLHADLAAIGRDGRLGWLADNLVAAIELDLVTVDPLDRGLVRAEHRALLLLRNLLVHLPRTDRAIDVLDETIRSLTTQEQLLRDGPALARSWRVVSPLRPEDFLEALRAARAAA